jgi:hypothetical protein
MSIPPICHVEHKLSHTDKLHVKELIWLNCDSALKVIRYIFGVCCFLWLWWGCSLARDDDGLQKQANNDLLTAQG